jgi:dGTPase
MKTRAAQLDWNRLLSAGRLEPSPKIRGDFRSEFERDYDRALFSAPVRRLQDKAQVFPLEANDSIRTRLTHSLEVSSIARTLGRRCAPFIARKSGLPAVRLRDIEIVCQTAGLLHDVGNPPFGHAGEGAIAGWFAEKLASDKSIKRRIKLFSKDGLGEQRINDFIKFDGNSQTFRILTRLQLVDHYSGLNFTYATLAVLLKYAAPSHRAKKKNAQFKKHGYFYSENDIVEKVRRETGVKTFRHPLTYLVEAADDIAYGVVDIEDALKKKVVDWSLFDEPQFKALQKYVRRAECDVDASKLSKGQRDFEREHACASRLRTILITELVGSVVRAFERYYPQIMKGTMRKPLEDACDLAQVFAACKTVTKEHVYFAKDILKLEIMGRRVVTDLLTIFWEGVAGYTKGIGVYHFPNKVWELLSLNYRYVYARDAELGELGKGRGFNHYLAFHLVADQVCGMTETFACRLHRELLNSGEP